MNYLEVLDQVRTHVAGLFHAQKDDRLIYHDLVHTEDVVKAVVKIANHYQLADQDFFIVNTAAWFHDTGYLTDFTEHEARGAAAAKAYLTAKSVDPDVIEQVANCILSTKMPQHPVGLLEQIVCDADLFHLGSESFRERSKLMRKEVQACMGRDIDKADWRLKTIWLFENHHYHTAYAQELLSAKKQMNLEWLKEKVAEEQDKEEKHKAAAEHKKEETRINTEAADTTMEMSKKDKEIEKHLQDIIALKTAEDEQPAKKKKNDRPDKGIETMFRITSGNHQRLSDMADNKAHIMISTNSIILSVILSILLRKLEDNPHLIIPTLILLIICVVTMVFSILATRPAVPPGTFTQEDIREKRTNLLFFGNFYNMSLVDYNAGMQKMMDDREFLYGSLVRDLYSQGVVLGRKYRLLRVAYNVFMYGIIAAVLAFVIAFALVAI